MHIVADILASLDSIDDLSCSIRSHSIFHTTFKEYPNSIVRRIILCQIPEFLLPFAIAHVDIVRNEATSSETERGQVKDLIQATWTTQDSKVRSLLETLSLKEMALMSRTYSAVEFLTNDFAADALPRLQDVLGFTRLSKDLSDIERLRIGRALYIYQITNVVSFNVQYRRMELLKESRSRSLWKNSTPSVKEQVACVYEYLRRKISRGNEYMPSRLLASKTDISLGSIR